jgi:hypothetical protein
MGNIMSHIRCPLCGLNAAISRFDPSELDLDLRVTSFKGLGYGRGFAPAEEHSVLGDDEYSPMVAERVCALCKMFLDAGVINSEYTMNKLGLKPKSSIPIEVPTRPQIRTVYIPIESSYELTHARETIEEQKKEFERERMIDRELLRLIQSYPYVEINEDEIPWTIEITDVDTESLPTLILLYDGLDLNIQKHLRKRLKTEHPIVEYYLKLFTKNPKKTIAERMLELDTNTVSVFNSGLQERRFEPI